MSLISRKMLFETIPLLIQPKRFRGKYIVQKPRPPHFEKAKYLALVKPFFISQKKEKAPVDLCQKHINPYSKDDFNPLQEIIAKELYERLTKSRLVAFFHVNSINADKSFKAFSLFHKNNMHLKQYGRKTVKMAVEGTPYEAILSLYVSQNMLLCSPEGNIKKMLSILKKFPQLVLLAGIYEGRFLSKDELLHYSTIPNIETARVGLVQTLNAAASQLVGHLNAHQSTLVTQLEQRIDQLKEKKEDK